MYPYEGHRPLSVEGRRGSWREGAAVRAVSFVDPASAVAVGALIKKMSDWNVPKWSYVGFDGGSSRKNLRGEFDREADLKNQLAEAPNFSTPSLFIGPVQKKMRAVPVDTHINENRGRIGAVFYGGRSKVHGLVRRNDVVQYRPLVAEKELTRDVSGTATQQKWYKGDQTEGGTDDSTFWQSPFCEKKLVAQMYLQAIAANGHTNAHNPLAGHTAGAQSLVNTATGHYSFLPSVNPIGVFGDPNQTPLQGPSDGSHRAMYTMDSRFYLESFNDNYMLYNRGNNTITFRVFVVCPRLRQNRLGNYFDMQTPDGSDFVGFWDRLLNESIANMAYYDDTSAADTLDAAGATSITDADVAAFKPAGVESGMASFKKRLLAIDDMSKAVHWSKFPQIRKWFRVKEMFVKLRAGEHCDFNIRIGPQVCYLKDIYDSYLPNLAYRVFVWTHGEMCNGGGGDDLGHAAHGYIVRRKQKYRVRLATPKAPLPITLRFATLNEATDATAFGDGEVIEEGSMQVVTGAEDA